MKQVVSRGHTRPVTEISFVDEGAGRTLLVSSAHDKTPQIRLGETGDWIGSFHGHKGAVWSAKVDTRTRTLAVSGSGDFTAKLWCVTTGKELHEFKHKHVVKSVDFSANTERIATGCQDGLMRVYDTCRPEQAPDVYNVGLASTEAVTKLAWSPIEDNTVILGKRSGTVEKWDFRVQPTAGPAISITMPGSVKNVMDVQLIAPHNMMMVAVGKKVCTYSLDSFAPVKEFEMPDKMTFVEEGGADLSPDGTKFLAGASDLWLREFDFATGEVLRVFKGHHGPIRSVRYHPSGRMGASGSEDATIRMWDLDYTGPLQKNDIGSAKQ